MKYSRIGAGLTVVIVVLIISGIACTNFTIPGKDTGEVTTNSCEGCHTDYERLQEVYTPDLAAAVGGYVGDIPHYEPYDRVFMGGDGYDSFKESGHYSVGCTGCHNGVGDTGDKDLAHSGEFMKHPSMYYDDKCASCHTEITDNFVTSLHQGTGQKRNVAMRSGLSGSEEFDQLPAHQIEGYNNNCAQCHGTCGNCHVVRPPVGGGGLAMGHNFNKTPDMQDVCITCHISSAGHAFLGEAADSEPDLHSAEKDCLGCHDGHELHGNGEPVEQRYAYTELPKCEDCHTGIEKANSYHSFHIDDFNCQVCHSQDYNNCGNCHIGGEGALIQSYQGFKIALNPIPDIKVGYEFALVRRTPAAPDNWKEYGVEEYATFSVLPTYNYTTPHNLLRWTTRTKVENGAACNSNCHIREEGGTLFNKDLYLFKSDLLDWELEATGSITVDGSLPSSWPD